MALKKFSQHSSHGKNLCNDLFDFLNQEKASFEHNLIPDLSYINSLAECVDSITIETVEYNVNNKYTLLYSFEWAAYNGCFGCSDIEGTGTIKTCISFVLEEDGQVIFDTSSLQSNTTADEL